jgi:hypothetical protein
MKSRILVLFFAVAAVLALAAAAQAKGPIQATVTGPGVDSLSFGGSGEPGSGSALGALTDQSGFFPATFGQSPDPMLAGRPKGNLGPRYTVSYKVPGPNNESDVIRQDLYPYAANGAVTYTKPGQPFFETQKTRGGWFQASPLLKDTLVAAGLPRTAPSIGGGDASIWSLDLGRTALIAALTLLLLAAAAIVTVRRRPGAAPAAR